MQVSKEEDKKKYNKDYFYKVGDIVNGLEILSQARWGERNLKAYMTRCINDGYRSPKPIREDHLKRGVGCSLCRNQMVVRGINDLYTTANWMCKYIVREEYWYTHTKSSNKKVLVRCSNCNREKYIIVNNLYNQGFSCDCSDGNSYPNKFVYALLNQLNIEYETEKTFDWSEGKRYDIYIPSLRCIIENHGKQHYEENGGTWKSLYQEQTNDLMKKILANGNGIIHYVELDCRKSQVKWIKNSIKNSELLELLHFTENDINWNKCEEFALSNLVKQVCEYKKETDKTLTEIGEKFKINRATVSKYLSYGVKLGWCEYNGEEERIKAVSKNGKGNGKRVEILKDGISLGVFQNCHELERQSESIFNTKLSQGGISNVARGVRDSYKGYVFKYID